MSAPSPSTLDANQVLQGSFDESNGRLRVDAIVTATIADVIINATESSIAIADQNTGDLLTINPDGTIDVNTIIKASDDNIQIRDPNNGNNLTINVDGSINIGNFPSSTSVTQGTSPWVISGTITANAGTNLNTSLLALDSTVAKDASLTTINTSINTLLKSANTLTAVTTLGTITNVVHVDDNAGSLTIDQPTASNLNAQVVGNIASAATDSGNPVKVGAVFNSTLAAITNGQRSNLQTNQFGELAVIIRNKFLNVHGAATTVVKSGSGRLNALVFNSGTSSSIVTIYDNIVASGTIIATINPANSGPFYLQYNAEFSTGLTVTTTVSATDITVLYQ